MKKLIRLIVLFLFIISFPAGCGKQDSGVITIRVAWFSSPRWVKIFKKAIQNWEKDHPGVKIVTEPVSALQYRQKILTAVSGGVAPDVIWVENTQFPIFQEKDILLDLTNFIKKDSSVNLKNYWPELIDRFTVKGRTYVLPSDTAPIACIYYNKTLFDNAGIPYPDGSWDVYEMLKIAKNLSNDFNGDGKLDTWGFYTQYWQNFLYSFGGGYVDDVKNPTKCIINSPESLAGIKFYHDIFHVHNAALPRNAVEEGMGMRESIWFFMTGKLGMYCSGVWDAPTCQYTKAFDWDVAMFPKGPDGTRRFATGGSGWGVVKTTKHPEIAFEVAKIMGGPEGQIELAKSGGFQPSLIKLAKGPFWAGSPVKPLNKGMLNEAVQYVVYHPFTSHYPEYEEMVDPVMDMIWNGTLSPEEGADRAKTVIDKIMGFDK